MMGILKNFIEKYRQKKAKERELQEDLEVQKHVMEKQKDANDRELERYYEEKRKMNVQKQLERFRKQKTNEIWRSNLFTNNKNLFAKDRVYLGRYY